MSRMGRILRVVNGRWEARHPPTPIELAISAVLLGLMALAVMLAWAGGEAFLYEGF